MTPQSAIYLDYQATTPTDPRVVESMIPYYYQLFGNPSSSENSFGWKANDAIEEARRETANLIGADTDEIIFTSGATEANNLAILGLAKSCAGTRQRIFVSAIEHKSVLAPARRLLQDGFKSEVIPVNSFGEIDTAWLEKSLNKQTLLVSVMAANNEVGTLQNLQKIAEICHSSGALFHVDASQAFPSLAINVFDVDIDLLSLSGHKIYGPKGIGALYIKRELHNFISPLLFGGEQENAIRPGTVPTPLCVGLGKASSIMVEQWEADRSHNSNLSKILLDLLSSRIRGIELIGPPVRNRHCGNLNLLFPGVDAGEIIAKTQPLLGISSGSACTSGMTEPSHVLTALGLSGDQNRSCLRISTGRMTTKNEITIAAELLCSAYKALKG